MLLVLKIEGQGDVSSSGKRKRQGKGFSPRASRKEQSPECCIGEIIDRPMMQNREPRNRSP